MIAGFGVSLAMLVWMTSPDALRFSEQSMLASVHTGQVKCNGAVGQVQLGCECKQSNHRCTTCDGPWTYPDGTPYYRKCKTLLGNDPLLWYCFTASPTDSCTYTTNTVCGSETHWAQSNCTTQIGTAAACHKADC